MSGRVFTAAVLATMRPGGAAYGMLEDGAIAVGQGQIAWVGPRAALPERFAQWPRTDYGSRLITPALIDCHTHLVHAGDRAGEFELRLNGASYAEIAHAGGGILATVRATRDASEDALLEGALARLDVMLAEGIGTIEVKSGYGLILGAELRMLRAARRLAEERPVRVQTTFLGAHALPPEYAGRADAYIDLVCKEMLPAVAQQGLADAVDGFCESIAFSPEQIERVFTVARDLGLPVKLHAEQLSDLGGAALAANFGALSADHLEYLDPSGINAMARAGTVAVLLPGAFYTLGETRLPPVDGLRRAGVPLAVATDCNPGSSPLLSPLLAGNMACTLFSLTPEEVLAGLTREAARALGLGGGAGMIQTDAPADLAVWNLAKPVDLFYQMGHRPLHARIHGGEIV